VRGPIEHHGREEEEERGKGKEGKMEEAQRREEEERGKGKGERGKRRNELGWKT